MFTKIWRIKSVLARTLRHTATHCNTLQHTATHCNTLQHTATYCNILEHTATHCSTLQHTSTHCSTLQHTATNPGVTIRANPSKSANDTTHCKTMPNSASHCNTLQHTALPDLADQGGTLSSRELPKMRAGTPSEGESLTASMDGNGKTVYYRLLLLQCVAVCSSVLQCVTDYRCTQQSQVKSMRLQKRG